MRLLLVLTRGGKNCMGPFRMILGNDLKVDRTRTFSIYPFSIQPFVSCKTSLLAVCKDDDSTGCPDHRAFANRQLGSFYDGRESSGTAYSILLHRI
jgi:hypothetical protein